MFKDASLGGTVLVQPYGHLIFTFKYKTLLDTVLVLGESVRTWLNVFLFLSNVLRSFTIPCVYIRHSEDFPPPTLSFPFLAYLPPTHFFPGPWCHWTGTVH